MSFLSSFRAAGIASSFTSSLMNAVKEFETTIDQAMTLEQQQQLQNGDEEGSTISRVLYDDMGNIIIPDKTTTADVPSSDDSEFLSGTSSSLLPPLSSLLTETLSSSLSTVTNALIDNTTTTENDNLIPTTSLSSAPSTSASSGWKTVSKTVKKQTLSVSPIAATTTVPLSSSTTTVNSSSPSPTTETLAVTKLIIPDKNINKESRKESSSSIRASTLPSVPSASSETITMMTLNTHVSSVPFPQSNESTSPSVSYPTVTLTSSSTTITGDIDKDIGGWDHDDDLELDHHPSVDTVVQKKTLTADSSSSSVPSNTIIIDTVVANANATDENLTVPKTTENHTNVPFFTAERLKVSEESIPAVHQSSSSSHGGKGTIESANQESTMVNNSSNLGNEQRIIEIPSESISGPSASTVEPSSTPTNPTVTLLPSSSSSTSVPFDPTSSLPFIELQAQYTSLTEQNQLLSAKLTAMETLLQSRETQLAKASTTAAAALDDTHTLQQQYNQLETQMRHLNTKYEEEKTLRIRHETTLNSLQLSQQSNDSSYTKQIVSLNNQIKNLETEVQERDTRIQDILTEGEGLSKKIANLEGTIKKLRETIKNTEADRDARKEELNIADNEISNLKRRVEELESIVDISTRDKDTASESASASATRLSTLEEEAAKLRSENKALRSNLASVTKEVEDNRIVVARALADLEHIEKENETLEANLQISRTNEAANSRQVQLYEENMKELRKQLSTIQLTAGKREDELTAALEEMINRYQRASAAAEDNGITALAQAYGVTLDQPSSSNNDTLSSGTSKTSNTSSMEALIAQLATVQAELQSRRDAWTSQRMTLQARLEATETALERAENDVRRMESTTADATASMNALKTEIATLRSSKNRSDTEISLLTERLTEAEEKFTTVTNAYETTLRNSRESTSTITDLRAKLDEALGSRAASTHMVSVLREQLTTANEEITLLKKDIQNVRKSMDTMTTTTNNNNSNRENTNGSPLKPTNDTETTREPHTPNSSDTGPETNNPNNSIDKSVVATQAWLQSTLSSIPSPLTSLSQSNGLRTPYGSATPKGNYANGLSRFQTPLSALPTSALQTVVEDLEMERNHLADTVVILSSKVKQYENTESELYQTRLALQHAEQQHEVVLEMLGEREEEIEALTSDLEEVKLAFREQIESLLRNEQQTMGTANDVPPSTGTE